MSSEIISCSCEGTAAAVAGNNVIIENPFKNRSDTNFEIIRYKPLRERLLEGSPIFAYKYIEDIKETLQQSCNFERIKEVLYYLERNPNIYDIVPDLLNFISCELQKEDQQRAPILLRALYCLYTNSVSAVTDFSVCTKSLEHFLTKSSTFPGDYVLKDIAADILSDFCTMSPSDDLKEHFVLELSRVFHNPNWQSYNLYGGIVGCLSNMSVKRGAELVPYEEFNSSAFLKHILSSPKMLRKLFYLCKPFIYSSLPSRSIPMPLHSEKSFYDLNTRNAHFFNLMRNEMLTPISYVKYDHNFSDNYQFEGGWFDDAKWSDLPADCERKDLFHPGFSAYRREKMLKKKTDGEGNERNSPIDAVSEGSINSNESERNLEIDSKSKSSGESLMNMQIDSKSNDNRNSNKSVQDSETGCKSDGYLYISRREGSLQSGHKSDGCAENFNKKKYSDFDRTEYTKIWLDKYGSNAKRNESDPLIDKEPDDFSDFSCRASCSRPVFKSDGYARKSKKRKYLDFDRKSDNTKRRLGEYEGNAKFSTSEVDPEIDRDSDGCVGSSSEIKRCGGLHKQHIQRDFSESDTDGSKSEENLHVENEKKLRTLNLRRHQDSRKKIDMKGLGKREVQSDFFKGNTRGSNSDENFQIKNETKLHCTNQKHLRVSLKKIDGKFDDNMDSHRISPQVDSKYTDDISRCEKEKILQVISESNVKTCESERISQIDNKCGDSSKSGESGSDFQKNIKSESDKDNSGNELNFPIKNDGDLESYKTDGDSLTGCKLKVDMKSSESFLSLPLISPGRLGSFQTGDKSESNRNINSGENLQIEHNSDLNSGKTERILYTDCKSDDMDIDEKNLQAENKSSRDVKNSESERNSQIDSKHGGNTDVTDCEKNLLDDNKSEEENLLYNKKSEEENLHDDNKSEEDKNSECESDFSFRIVYDSRVDGMKDCERNSGAHWDSTGVSHSEMNLLAHSKPYDWDRHLQDDSKYTEPTKVETNEEMRREAGSQKAKKSDDRAKTKRSESPGFSCPQEFSDYLAWKRERSYADSHKWNKIGETLELIPPPAHIDESMFEHRDEDYSVPDTHVISSDYISEESVAAGGHCCERANVCCVNPSTLGASQHERDIFKNLDKSMFANWEFKKPKAAKKESQGAEKSDTKGQLQKKCKTRNKRKR